MTSIARDLLFGTAGVPKSSPDTSSVSGIKTIQKLNLDCMEVEFVKGIKMGPDTAQLIKQEAQERNIQLSVHAPYYINLNSPEEGKRLLSQERILSSARLAERCGARYVVFHCGYYGKKSPKESFEAVKEGIKEVVSILRSERSPVILRPETLGKKAQFGSFDEILFLCREVEGLQPCIDFSHIHAREGRANSYAEFTRILKKIEKKLGTNAVKNMHIHISGIKYGEKGELKHLNLQESDFRFDEWIQALKDYGVAGCIICESPDQASDAVMLKKLYYS